MILISEIYNDVALDNINTSSNGDMSFERFNRLSKRAELRMLDFLTADVEDLKPPTPYTSQKDKDWLSMYIEKKPVQVVDGKVTKPEGYYGWENSYLLGSFNDTTTCDDAADIPIVGCNTPLEMLNGVQFYERCITYIEGLQPSFSKPICKIVGNEFEFLPKDLGSIVLEYYKYPAYGKIVPKMDDLYNVEVIDEDKSTNYQYEEWARELLVYFICESFGIHTRENAIQTQLKATGALVRDAKQ